MTGFSWVPITALFCYLFLFLTFLTSGKKEKVIRSFMLLMLIMILWAGGSFAMRMQLWPSVNFWHHVSLLGMMMVASGYFCFVLDFLEEKNSFMKWLWGAFHLLLFVFNCITGLFVPEPEVIQDSASVQFIYTYTWHIYLLLACILPCLIQNVLVIRRHCTGNQIAFQQLKPILGGLAILLLGHVAATLPGFVGLPLDIISGPINAIFVFYALYKKRLFKMSLLLSKANYIAFAVAVGCIVCGRVAGLLQNLLISSVGLSHETAIVAVAVILVFVVAAVYGLTSLILNTIFVRSERLQQSKIDHFAEEITHMLSVADILQNMTDVIQSTTRIERMAVFVHQMDGDYRVEHTTNPLDEKAFYLRGDHPLVTYFQKHGTYISLSEFMRTTVYRSMWEKEKHLFTTLKAGCFVPLVSGGDVVGIISLPEKKDMQPYQESELGIVQSMADICADAVKEACVYERAIDEARTDKLTGLINKKYFSELLFSEFERYKDTALSLCLLSIDDFKLYNQLYGTQEGDIALTAIAGVFRSSISETSRAARIGGKEFALLLPGYDIYSAKLLTENLVAEIAEINSRKGGNIPRKLTVSAGICASPYMASSAKELYQNAETAMYTAKRSGKNAVQIYSSEIYHYESEKLQHNSGYSEHASTIYALTAAIDTKDHYTFRHSESVAYYASELAKAAGMEQDLIEIAREAALLHDIGKIGIREDILNKPGKLTDDEYEIIKGHVENAINIIRYLPSLEYVIPAVSSHHERYDGRGYPRQLEGEEIPILGRILSIADSFDAMTSDRSYKAALPVEEAVAVLRQEAGKQFDPKLVLIFIDLVEKQAITVGGQYTDATMSPREERLEDVDALLGITL